MKLKLRIYSLRGVYHWIAYRGDEVSDLGPVADASIDDIVWAWRAIQ